MNPKLYTYTITVESTKAIQPGCIPWSESAGSGPMNPWDRLESLKRAGACMTRIEREDPWTAWPFEDPAEYWQQREYWTDAKSVRHPISEMSLDYLANILRMIQTEPYKVRGDMTNQELRLTPLVSELQNHMMAAASGKVHRPVPADAYSNRVFHGAEPEGYAYSY